MKMVHFHEKPLKRHDFLEFEGFWCFFFSFFFRTWITPAGSQPAGQAASPASQAANSWPAGAAVDKQIAKIDENTYQKIQKTIKMNRHLTTMASIEKASFSLGFP